MPNKAEWLADYARHKKERKERKRKLVERWWRDRELRKRELPGIGKAQKRRCKGFFTCDEVEGGEAVSLCPWGKRKVPRAAQQLDHKIRVADGGSDDPSNLQMLCACCHAMKTAVENGAVVTGRDTPSPPPPAPPKEFVTVSIPGSSFCLSFTPRPSK